MEIKLAINICVTEGPSLTHFIRISVRVKLFLARQIPPNSKTFKKVFKKRISSCPWGWWNWRWSGSMIFQTKTFYFEITKNNTTRLGWSVDETILYNIYFSLISKEEITKLVLWKKLNRQQHSSLLFILFENFLLQSLKCQRPWTTFRKPGR